MDGAEVPWVFWLVKQTWLMHGMRQILLATGMHSADLSTVGTWVPIMTRRHYPPHYWASCNLILAKSFIIVPKSISTLWSSWVWSTRSALALPTLDTSHQYQLPSSNVGMVNMAINGSIMKYCYGYFMTYFKSVTTAQEAMTALVKCHSWAFQSPVVAATICKVGLMNMKNNSRSWSTIFFRPN